MYKKRYVIGCAIVLFVSCFLSAEEQNLIIPFGATEGELVEQGFIFLNGEYIKPPYKLSRQGLSLYINNLEIVSNDLILTHEALFKDKSFQESEGTIKGRYVSKIDHIIGKYTKQLQKGSCYFFFSDNPHIELSPHQAAYDLPTVIQKLKTCATQEDKNKVIQSQGWQLKLDQNNIDRLTLGLSADNNIQVRLSNLAENLLKKDIFGEDIGEPIQEGFVLYNGRYIDYPYVVSREGLGVYINDIMVLKPRNEESKTNQNLDPSLPKWVVKGSSFEEIREHLTEKYCYLISHYSETEAMNLIIEYYNSLPCIKGAHLISDNSVLLEFFNGDSLTVDISASTFSKGENRKSAIEQAKDSKKRYEELLEEGSCVIISEGAEMTIPASRLPKVLPDMLSVLQLSVDNQTKYEKLAELGMSYINKNSFSDLVVNFSTSPQLQSRIGKIKEFEGK